MGTHTRQSAPSIGAVNATNVIPNAAEATGNSTPPLTFEAVEAAMSSITSLSAEGQKYVADLTDLFAKDGRIAVEPIPYRVESVACIELATKNAIILTFSESYLGTPNNLPPTEIMPDIRAAFGTKYPDAILREYIIVTPEDYGRVKKMAAHIANSFAALDPNYAIKAAMFNKMHLTTSTDLQQVKNFINKYSPHEVMERADWGILVSRVVNNQRLDSYQAMREPELKPIAGVIGYTRFIQIVDRGQHKFVPIVTITNVTCTVPSTEILSVVLPIVAGCVISQRQWERPYCTFAKNAPNLGRLIVDPVKKELKWFGNLDEMHMEMANYISDVPFLALDFAEGRARIPGMEKYIIDGNKAIHDQLTDFFGAQVAAGFCMQQTPIVTTFMNYEGVYKNGTAQVDTRSGDFINMITDTKDFNRCKCALDQSMAPAAHLQTIMSIYGDDTVTPLYRVHTVIFNSELINLLAGAVSNIITYNSESCMNQNVDMNALMHQFNATIGGNYMLYGVAGCTNRPGNIYY